MKNSQNCLIAISDLTEEKQKILYKEIKLLLKKNYRYFYFLFNDSSNLAVAKKVKQMKKLAKCFYIQYHRELLWINDAFDVTLPIAFDKFYDKIRWAENGCDSIISNFEKLDTMMNIILI